MNTTTHCLLMGWDPSVMRKFAATSHQRLLHQLRSDLKNDHSARPLPARVTEPDGRAAAAPQGNTSSPSSQGSQEKRPRSFRERLNAVDMR